MLLQLLPIQILGSNELRLGLSLYFMNGIGEGIKTSLKMQKIGLGMLMTKRLTPMELIGGHKCKDARGLQAILKKAEELEAARIPVAGK